MSCDATYASPALAAETWHADEPQRYASSQMASGLSRSFDSQGTGTRCPREVSMDTDTRHVADKAPGGITSIHVIFARLTWALFGPVLLALSLYQIASFPGGWFTRWDAAIFIVAGIMIWCRLAELRSGQGTTAWGEPATMAHVKRYAQILIVLVVAAWILANLLGNHILP